ncbi:nucleosidase [Streptomyces sp. NPDC059582]|uniref:5'-methylthioadenosine/S-adenosylhomocysteine nucleosidase family protein n=1 Tax=Streptomyces sp. NPDC059582 TaxID=3346875 RepID=UPI0036C3AE6E
MPETNPTVVVLTALALEYAAVRSHLTDRVEHVHPEGTRVELGRLDGTPWTVAVAELGEGAVATAALTTRIASWLRPQAVFFVGIAGSLKSDIGIGDVVVGTKVYGIHGGKQTSKGFLVRPEAWPASHALVQATRSAVRDMPDVRAHFKPIAAGDVVLADSRSDIARHLREHYNDAAAIEMEGSGAAHAAHLDGQLDALVIRGISDLADARKSAADQGGSQQRAAAQAASVAMAALRKHRPRADSSGARGDLRRGSDGGPGGAFADGPVYHGDHIDFSNGTFLGPVVGKTTRGDRAPRGE